MFISRQDNRLTGEKIRTAYNDVRHSINSIQQDRSKRLSGALLLLTLAVLILPGSALLFSKQTANAAQTNPSHLAFANTRGGRGGRAVPGLTPQDLWKQYNLPGVNGGAGQLLAVVIDSGEPNIESDLTAYSQRFGLPTCTVANGCLTIKNRGGQPISPGPDEAEGTLDLETIHAVAPQAKLLLYSVQHGGDALARGPADLMNMPGLKAINMSYGFGGNTQQYQALFANNPHNISLFAASGDSGHGPTAHPASYPGVIAVGGTTITNGVEAAWRGAGGGLASNLPEPAYQKTYGIPQANGLRGVPDVAAVAGTPMTIYLRGQWNAMVGTSVAAPIWTGIAGLVNKPITHDMLYSLAKSQPDSFTDITRGTNGSCGFLCSAQTGYDYITGLGTPKNFVKNVNALP
ncbi:S53 family peptidase [Dictyobacter arantiisoli]|uniref:Serine protease n=1 Tax=Dictyobacter arantiisoli TaxID=2014874 RepID=A0A5A5TC23_9CHLR|nr:S53 family peptidase [Dictyobacter arantiisoli]GCF08484.1 serine protease [Dictyobacter arantiisoli]